MRRLLGNTGLPSLGTFRVALGLAQGLALYLLYLAHEERAWPATSGFTFAPLLVVALFIPPLVLQASGNIRARTLATWSAAAAALLAALAVYDIWNAWPLEWVWDREAGERAQGHWAPLLIPSPPFFLAAVLALFITHVLVTGADTDRKFIAEYRSYFDAAWKLALHLLLSVAFVGVFWGVLFLGASLFELIDIEVFSDLIEKSWFAIPVTTLATAVALHVSDVRSGIVRGIRTLALTLLSWLLPLLTLIVVGFLVTLPFTGLQALWDTRFASALLLVVSAALLVFINAAYKDGDSTEFPPRPLRLSASAAALCLLPLAILCLVAVGLRVQQYGWTVDRIFAAALGAVALLYGLGYLGAALLRGPWLARIERWNIYTAFFVVALILALFSPLLNPTRIAVASQMARLERGAVPDEEFDYAYLRWQGGRHGQRALETLKRDAQAGARTAQLAVIDKVLASTTPYEAESAQPRVTQAERLANVAVYPEGRTLPEEFLAENWTDDRALAVPECLRLPERPCDAFLLDLNRDGRDEIVVADDQIRVVAARGADGRWSMAGTLGAIGPCPTFRDSMKRQGFGVVAPAESWNEIEIGGRRLGLVPAAPAARGPDAC